MRRRTVMVTRFWSCSSFRRSALAAAAMEASTSPSSAFASLCLTTSARPPWCRLARSNNGKLPVRTVHVVLEGRAQSGVAHHCHFLRGALQAHGRLLRGFGFTLQENSYIDLQMMVREKCIRVQCDA